MCVSLCAVKDGTFITHMAGPLGIECGPLGIEYGPLGKECGPLGTECGPLGIECALPGTQCIGSIPTIIETNSMFYSYVFCF